MVKVGHHEVLVWGASSKARILVAMIEDLSLGRIAALHDPTLDRPSFPTEATFSKNTEELNRRLPHLTAAVVAIGGAYGEARLATARCLQNLGLTILTLRHPSAFFDPTSNVGSGLQMMPRSIVHKFCSLGEHVIINTNAAIDHECLIGNGCHIMGSAAIAGRVTLADYVTVGTNATILPDLTIGEGAYIGAGAVVTRNVPPGAVMAGVPAKKIGERNDGRAPLGLIGLMRTN